MKKLAPAISVIGLVFIGLIFAALHQQHTMLAALPVPEIVRQADIDQMLARSVKLVGIQGTGSMQPVIPAGPGIVAYALVNPRSFDLLSPGDLVIYRIGETYIIHQLATQTATGWIASGLHNSNYDAARVTRANYVGVATRIFIPRQ